MYRDTGSHTEADAGAYERAHADDYDDDRPSRSDLADPGAPASPALTLPQAMRAVVEMAGGQARPITATANGASFPLVEGDSMDLFTPWFSWFNIETLVQDGVVYGRRKATR